jgi:hypothetical protein
MKSPSSGLIGSEAVEYLQTTTSMHEEFYIVVIGSGER